MKMKKFILVLIAIVLAVILSVALPTVSAEETGEETAKVNKTETPEKHLILNKDGSYGGTYNLEKYGEGAPLNGALDHTDAGYWKVNDFYNATSTTTRTMIHNFRGYQQTMEYTDGLACVLMILNLYGYDTDRLYSEQRLLKRYLQANNLDKLENDVTAEGMQKMLEKMGIFSDANTYDGYSRNNDDICAWVRECFANNQVPMIAFWGENDYKWYAIVGVDDMGDNNAATDVFILADPFDAFDHYQDGYRIIYMNNMLKFWLDMEEDIVLNADGSKETYSMRMEAFAIQAPEGFTLDTAVGPETLNKNEYVYEYNALQSYDFVTGETWACIKMRNDAGETPWGGTYNKWTSRATDTSSLLDTVYLTFNDWYNMDDEGTRLLLHNYATKLQTSASTCGVCSTLSALVYLGVPYDDTNRDLNDYTCTNEYKLMRQIEIAAGITVYNRGVANYEITKILDNYGMKALHSAGYNMTNYLKGTANKVYPTIQSMADQLKTDLANDNPFLIGWNSTGGHWEVVICYDDMGTPELYDDFCLLADSSDRFDHYYDGYDQFSLYQVYNRWYNGSFHWNQQGLAIAKK